MDQPRLLSLCSGYGGLDLAVQGLFGTRTVAFAERDTFASRVFAAHHQDVPNLGDITAVDWGHVRDTYAPDIIAAGFPCQDISNAGTRKGIDGDRSGIWKNVAEAVRVIRPRLVFLENVSAILRRGLDVVAGDLAALGYDARWTCLRAGDVGAPHPRDRWFCVAYPAAEDAHEQPGDAVGSAPGQTQGWGSRAQPAGRDGVPVPSLGERLTLLPTPKASDSEGTANFRADGTPYRPGYGRTLTDAIRLLPTPTARDWKSGASNLMERNARPLNEAAVNLLPTPKASDDRWVGTNGTDYGPAIRGWEEILGRSAPGPTEAGTKGNRRLSPVFVEWMMGLPAGWVTDVPDLPRREQLRILGNGVVPQQAAHAYRYLLTSTDFDNPGEEVMEDTKKTPLKGACAGCSFEYTLSAKGLIRKHLSRTGPGECGGSRKMPRERAETLETDTVISTAQQMGKYCERVMGSDAPDDVQSAALSLLDSAHADVCACGGVEEECPNRCTEAPGCRGERGCTGTPRCTGENWVPATPAGPGPVVSSGVQITTVPVAFDPENPVAAADQIKLRQLTTPPAPATTDMFADPAPAPSQLPPVSGQPEPDRDRWGRYVIGGQAHTRATTFAKLGSNTKAIEQWGHRNVAVGLTKRPDLMALATGLDVKRDREQLNQIVDQAKDAAGQKIAANVGTAYHAFTERLDAGQISLGDVPETYRARVKEYAEQVRNAGLVSRPEWIERTTAVSADMVSAPLPVGGTLDRIFQLPSGELVIGDLKTGSDLSYGMAEIEVQLAIYAHGVNRFGLYDWNTKQWEPLDKPVRTDLAIVIHLPADGAGCHLLRIDIERGWRRAQLRGQLQADQKEKSKVQWLTDTDLAPRALTPFEKAAEHFRGVESKERAAELYAYARDSGAFTEEELIALAEVGMRRLAELPPF